MTFLDIFNRVRSITCDHTTYLVKTLTSVHPTSNLIGKIDWQGNAYTKAERQELSDILWVLHSSVIEELGELAGALKIKTGVVKHKQAGEDPTGEAADVFICGLMMFIAVGGKASGIIMNSIADPSGLQNLPLKTGEAFTILARLSCFVGNLGMAIAKCDSERSEGYALEITSDSMTMYSLLVGKYVTMEDADFLGLVNSKLDKWEKHQNKLKANYAVNS